MKEIKNSINTIDDYILQFPEDVQTILRKLREIIKNAAPEASEKISYQMPTFYLNGNLVHFAAFQKHIGFYPTPSGIEAFQEEISQYKWAKGSIQFPLDQPIPYDLVERMVLYRVKESEKKKTKK